MNQLSSGLGRFTAYAPVADRCLTRTSTPTRLGTVLQAMCLLGRRHVSRLANPHASWCWWPWVALGTCRIYRLGSLTSVNCLADTNACILTTFCITFTRGWYNVLRLYRKFLEKIWEWGSGPPFFFRHPALPPPGVYGANRLWLIGGGGRQPGHKPSKHRAYKTWHCMDAQ